MSKEERIQEQIAEKLGIQVHDCSCDKSCGDQVLRFKGRRSPTMADGMVTTLWNALIAAETKLSEPQAVPEPIDWEKECDSLISWAMSPTSFRMSREKSVAWLKSFVQRIHSSVPQEPTKRERELLEIIDTMTAILGPSSQGRFRRRDKIFGEIMDLRTQAKFPAEWKAANPAHSSVPDTKGINEALVEALPQLNYILKTGCPCGGRDESLNTHPHLSCGIVKLKELAESALTSYREQK